MTIHLHGARPVPVSGATPAQWSPAGLDDTGEIPLRALAQPTAVPRVPDDHREVVNMALRPLRQWATAPIVGVEGGAGRTTVTRLLGRAFMTVRKEKLAAVDAVPLWGGLTAAVASPDGTGLTVQDVAAMEWPPQLPVEQLLNDRLAGDGPVPTVTSRSASKDGWANSDELDLCVRRVSALVDLTLVDTLADPLSIPIRELVEMQRTTPVWVCTATRDGLWRVSEAITVLQKLGAQDLIARSVVAVVGHVRRWPRDAAAAETQLSGRGLEVIRFRCSSDPLRSRRCARSAVRLVAAVVARSG